MIQYIFALLIAIVIEFIVYWIFIGKDPLKLLLYSVLINSFTLPLATFGYQIILSNLLVIEILVVLVESVLIMLLMTIKYPKALLISIVANLITALIGILIFV